MGSSIARIHLPPSPTSSFANPINCIRIIPSHIHPQKPISKTRPISKPASQTRSFSLPHVTISQPSSSVSEKVQRLGSEFRSLPQPIDRVKRLLHYAAILPPFEDSWRVQENRVLGCTTQVWLAAVMDGNGAMRFRVDSDSEITKGFCSCLIWVLDGAAAEEVLRVKSDDLIEMNVGLPSRGNSRVNAWNNVLISMQRRTKVLMEGVSSVNGSCCDKNQSPHEEAVHELS